MRAALTALSDELRRLKSVGVKSVSVSDESLVALRRVIAARKVGAAPVERHPVPLASAVVAPKPYEPPAPYSPPKIAAPKPAARLLPSPPTVALPEGAKQARWDALLSLVLNDTTCSSRVRRGKKVVLGVGSLEARIMFVGEAPGAEEEIQGEPFVGPAGQLLTKMIQAMGLKRSDVYIGNIMNWRPDLPTADGGAQIGNRPPTEEEIRYCLPYLRAQIDVVNPELIVALGSTAAQGLLGFGSFKALWEVSGRWHAFADKPLMVTYHPSYILREPTNKKKRMIWDDLLKVLERAALPITDRQRGYFLDK